MGMVKKISRRVWNSPALQHYLRQVQPQLHQVTEKMLTVGAKNHPNLKNNSIVEFSKSLQMLLDSMFLICFWLWPTKWNRNESENMNCEDKHLNQELQNSGILRTLKCCWYQVPLHVYFWALTGHKYCRHDETSHAAFWQSLQLVKFSCLSKQCILPSEKTLLQ